MQFFGNVVSTMSTVVTALGAGLAIWGGINLLEGYGADNPGAKSQGIKQFMPSYMEPQKILYQELHNPDGTG